MGGGRGAVGHTWCGPPYPGCCGVTISWETRAARYASRSASNPPPLCKIDFTTRPWGTYIYTRRAPPTRGLIYATTDLAKPTQGTTFTFPTHRRSALAPIVNGLSTDVKLLFCRQIFCLSSTAALFRSPLSGGRNLEWDYARCHPIQSDSILSPSQKY